MAQVDFFFDFGSPTAYLAYTQMPGLAARTGATVNYRPVLLGGIFKATGNRAPAEVPAKGKWLFADIMRFAKRYGVPLKLNPHFPVNTITVMRAAHAAQQAGQLIPYSDAVYQAMWVDGRPMADRATIVAVLTAAGLDAEALLTAADTQEVKDSLRIATEEAVARGLFGAPSFIVGDELQFGQDRLDFVEEALRRG